jgi:Derlin-2/3
MVSAMIMAFVYTYSQTNRGTKTRFFFIDIPTVALPYAMLLVEMVRNGWRSALVEAMGILAAHLYDFLTRIYPTFGGGRNFITVPGFVERYFTSHDPDSGNRGYGTAVRPTRPANQPSSASTSGSSLGGWTFSSSWSGRGAGRRLG